MLLSVILPHLAIPMTYFVFRWIFHIFFPIIEYIRINRSWMWQKQRRRRNVFGGGGGTLFSSFFRGEILFFPGEISVLVHPKQISVASKSDKQKKKRKKERKKKKKKKKRKKKSSSSHFFFILLFSLPLFSRLVSKKFTANNVRGALCPTRTPHPPVTPLDKSVHFVIFCSTVVGLGIVQQVILENRASLYCWHCIDEPSF